MIPSTPSFFFSADEVTGWSSVSGSDKEAFGQFFHRMVDEGVYLPPSPFEAMFVSTAHSGDDIDATIEAAERALR